MRSLKIICPSSHFGFEPIRVLVTRRNFLVFLLVLAAPLTTKAERASKIPRIGALMDGSFESRREFMDAFRHGLRDAGYTEGQDIVIESRFVEGGEERLHAVALQLVRLDVDVIVTSGVPGARAAKRATATIPIVVAAASDFVGTGLVASLARPGGNVTGTDSLTAELSVKRLELLKEVNPRLSRIGVLWNQLNPGAAGSWEMTRAAARQLKVDVVSLGVRGPDDLEAAFAAAITSGVEALVVIQDPLAIQHRVPIAELAASSRLPAVYGAKQFVEAGGLMGYGVDLRAAFRRAAIFVDKILKGAKPSQLPVEQPTKFELVINFKTAKRVGLVIPPSLLLRADQVIE